MKAILYDLATAAICIAACANVLFFLIFVL